MINNAYAHMAYKLTNPTGMISQLGIMSMEQVHKRFLHGMYPYADVEIATHQCASEGLLTCVWVVEGQHVFTEENFNEFRTLKQIQNGDIFNERTGKKFDVSSVGMHWCVSQSVLNKIIDPGGFKSLLDRMLRWLRFWERK